ncbi:hypothetical protein ACS0TY_003066 [Phlomoides rotata]
MQLPEIKIAIAAIRSARGLPLLEDFKRRMPHMDLLDWLQFSFGFQLEDGAVDEQMKKFFKNYTEWCKFLDRKSNIRSA